MKIFVISDFENELQINKRKIFKVKYFMIILKSVWNIGMYFSFIIIYNASSKTFEFNCIYYYKCHVNKEDNLLAFREVRNIVQWLRMADFYSIISYRATLERDATEDNRCVFESCQNLYVYSLNSHILL